VFLWIYRVIVKSLKAFHIVKMFANR